jgi:hypothetical protein
LPLERAGEPEEDRREAEEHEREHDSNGYA